MGPRAPTAWGPRAPPADRIRPGPVVDSLAGEERAPASGSAGRIRGRKTGNDPARPLDGGAARLWTLGRAQSRQRRGAVGVRGGAARLGRGVPAARGAAAPAGDPRAPPGEARAC